MYPTFPEENISSSLMDGVFPGGATPVRALVPAKDSFRTKNAVGFPEYEYCFQNLNHFIMTRASSPLA
jgi:hypothetical protein